MRLCYAISSSGGVLTACVGCGWDHSSVESVQRDRTPAGAAALPRPGHLLLLYCSSVWWVTCTASCMRARSMSWPGAWSEPGSITQGLGETPPWSLQTAPSDSDQRTRASPAESLRYNINKDAEDSSSYLSDLIFLKLAWLMLFIFHCSWLIFTKFSRQHLCLFLASLKPTRLA